MELTKEALEMKFSFIISLLLLAITSVKANENVLILDVSKSMREEVAGERKITLLKKAVSDFIGDWPEDQKLAVLAYGQQSKDRSKKSCRRVSTLNQLELVDKDRLNKKIARMKARGKSPMISSLYKATRKLESKSGNIILVSDGGESCGKKVSACDVAKDLKEKHPDLRIHTIDFEGDNELLRCIAEATEAEYRPINDMQALTTSLFSGGSVMDKLRENYSDKFGTVTLQSTESEGGEPISASYIVYSDEGKHVANYTSDEIVEKKLPVGSYTITSVYNLLSKDTNLDVLPDQKTEHTFVLGETGTVSLSANYRGRSTSVLYTIYSDSGLELASGMSDKVYKQRLPVGQYEIEAKRDGDKIVVSVAVQKDSNESLLLRF